MMIREDFDLPDRSERRHSPNRRKTRVAALADIEGELSPVTILDVSLHGMKLSVPTMLFPGSPVTVLVLDHRIRAIVHWYRLGHVGLRVMDRLDAATLLALENAHDDLAEYR